MSAAYTGNTSSANTLEELLGDWQKDSFCENFLQVTARTNQDIFVSRVYLTKTRTVFQRLLLPAATPAIVLPWRL